MSTSRAWLVIYVPGGCKCSTGSSPAEEQRAVGEKKRGTTGEESRGCDDEGGKFRAALSGKRVARPRSRGEGMEGDYGPTR